MRNVSTKFKAIIFTLVGVMAFSLFNSVSAQQIAADQGPDPNVTRYEPFQVPLAGFVVPTEIKEDWFSTLRNSRKVHQPGVDIRKDEYKAAKAAANKARAEYLAEHPVTPPAAGKTTGLGEPVVGNQFFGNGYDGGIPNDNAIATSNGGIIVSSTNSRIHIYNEDGTKTFEAAMGVFGSQPGVDGVGTTIGAGLKFDPKLTYDPVADRFIWVWLNGASSSSSNIVICFTKTNDPADGWWVYQVNGNVGTSAVWSDFPQIGITTDELVITTNLFLDAGGSVGSGVWQVKLSDGYAGDPLTIGLNTTTYFSLHPVSGGLDMYGPHAYMIRNDGFGGNAIYLHRISNTFSAGGVIEPPITLSGSAPSYGVPSDGDQPSATPLNTNECRVQTSYFQNNRIVFGFNTAGVGSKPSVYLGEIILSPLDLNFSQFKGQVVTMDDYDIAYPGVAYGGTQAITGFNTTLLSFNLCSPFTFPGNGAVYVDENGDVSDEVLLRQGNSSLGSGSAPWRWGDYADLAPRFNNPGEAWVGASYSWNTGGRTYISQIFPSDAVAIDPNKEDPNAANVYPSPTAADVVIDFPVTVADYYSVFVYGMNGEVIKELDTGYLRLGDGRAKFNTRHLANGTYFVTIMRDGAPVYREKFIVAH